MKKHLLILSLATLGIVLMNSFGANAQVMVKDINPGGGYSMTYNYNPYFTNVNGTLFFSATDGKKGFELWKSNGTAAGTVMVKDIRGGSTGSFPSYLTNVNGALFFEAEDGVHGKELWKSDGTAAGTVMVKDIYPGSINPNYSPSFYLTNYKDTLYFSANDSTNGWELWKSDGTDSGTVMVKDIFPGSGNSMASFNAYSPDFTTVNGILYFEAIDGTHGWELWRSDGTAAGTRMVKDIVPGINIYGTFNSSNPYYLTNVNGTLYFAAEDGINGFELWKSDGTDSGTVMIEDIYHGPMNSYPEYLTDVNGTLFFNADDNIHREELWKSDGTAAGTVMVKDIDPALGSGSHPSYLTNVNGTLYFTATDNGTSNKLWKSDGTAVGTVIVKNISPAYLINVNGILYFQGRDILHGNELWKSDGTDTGTVMLKDIFPGSTNSMSYNSPSSLANVNGTLFFAAADSAHGPELWKYCVSSSSPVITKNGNILTCSSTDSLYQWYDSSSVIKGATSKTYTVTKSGIYSVGITDTNGCNALSKSISAILTDIADLSNNQIIVSIYPNPTTGKANVAISQSADLKMNSIEIYNVYGECIHRQIATSSNCQIYLSEAPNGIYFMQVKTSGGTVNQKLIINK